MDLSKETYWRSENVKLWAFGHTPVNCDFVDDLTGKHVVTNQRGYYFAQAKGFDTMGIQILCQAFSRHTHCLH